jgi:site-specific DNA-methyltransferase (adenine-specific)
MEPLYDENGITVYNGDCRLIMPNLSPVDLVLTDPLYGETSFQWDRRVSGWIQLLPVKPETSMWCFGSLRSFMESEFPGWHLAQDVIWEKHNGIRHLNGIGCEIQ